jgi:two-component system, chemotaxis family, protein-glutamate methylesterase/glutaminase
MPPVSVLVVDDSVVVRKLVTRILDADPDLRVVGTAANGRIALEKIPLLAPDIVTLDIEMPDMDGLQTLAELRKIAPRLPVIMFSTLTERAAASTLDALALGASDYVTKPTQLRDPAEALEAVRQQLVPKIKALTGRTRRTLLPSAAPAGRPPAASPIRRPTGPPARPRVLAIGSSTGGPDALATLVAKLPAGLPVPVVVVQHMPPVFTRLFAQRLDRLTGITVREAVDKEPLRPGLMLIAPGDRHLSLRRDGERVVTVLSDGMPENHCRPAVDVLFRGVVDVYGANVLSVILTGMGQDGLRGGERVVEAGGALWAQDQATSVVWGMPGAVVNAGLASRVLPGGEIGAAIAAALSGSAEPTPAGALR